MSDERDALIARYAKAIIADVRDNAEWSVHVQLRNLLADAAGERQEPVARERQVACERSDGMLNVHPDSATCEVCAVQEPITAQRVIRDLAQIYGLLQEERYDEADDYCRAAADSYVQ